jgi:acyl-CoA thioesterase
MAEEAALRHITSRRDPVSEKLGITFGYAADGACVATLDAGPEVCNVHGVVHGAVLFAMADTGMGFALLEALGDKPLLSSISVTANYLRPAAPGRIEARASLVRLGRSVAFLACGVRDGQGDECAQVSGVFRVRTEREGNP